MAFGSMSHPVLEKLLIPVQSIMHDIIKGSPGATMTVEGLPTILDSVLLWCKNNNNNYYYNNNDIYDIKWMELEIKLQVYNTIITSIKNKLLNEK